MQEGTFVVVLISGEAWPAVFTGGVVHVIGSMASPAWSAGLEHAASP